MIEKKRFDAVKTDTAQAAGHGWQIRRLGLLSARPLLPLLAAGPADAAAGAGPDTFLGTHAQWQDTKGISGIFAKVTSFTKALPILFRIINFTPWYTVLGLILHKFWLHLYKFSLSGFTL